MAVPNVAISENFGDLLDARFRKIYQSEYKEAIDESMIPMLFKVMSQSSGADYRVSGIGGMGDIPTFDGSNYGAIGRPSTFRSVKDDLEALSMYTERGYGAILNGEIGRS